MNRAGIIASSVLLMGMTAATRAADESSSASKATLATEVKAAVTQLQDEDYATRTKAKKNLEAIFSEQALALGSIKDGESQASLIPVLVYNENLMRWLENVLALSEEERDVQLSLASQPGMLPIMARLFSSQTDSRIEAIHELQKTNTKELELMLPILINDNDRAVSVAAMEAAGDGKPTDAVVATLYHRAVEAGIAMWRVSPAAPAAPAVAVPAAMAVPMQNQKIEKFVPRTDARDCDIAGEALIRLNAVQVKGKLVKFFADAAAIIGKGTASPGDIMGFSGNERHTNVAYSLLAFFKPREAVPSLYVLATQPSITTAQYFERLGGSRFIASNRAAAIATFFILTGQPLGSFVQKDFAMGGRNIWVVANERDEDLAVKQIQDWWKEHAKEYGAS